MKKYILFMVSALIFAFTSCTDKEEIEIDYEIKMIINPKPVIDSFHGFTIDDKTSGLDMIEGSSLLLQSFVYDSNGKFVKRVSGKIDDYNKKATYPLGVSDSEEYTIITLSYAVYEDVSAYSVDGYYVGSEIQELSITQITTDSFYSNFSILGVNITTIDNSKSEININLEPATAMVEYVHNATISSITNAGIDQLFIGLDVYNKFNIYNSKYQKTGDQDIFRGSFLDITKLKFDENKEEFNIADIHNVFPKSNMIIAASAYSGEEQIKWIENDDTFDVRAGKSYEVICDFDNWAIKGELVTKSSDEMSTTRPTQSMKVTELIKNIK